MTLPTLLTVPRRAAGRAALLLLALWLVASAREASAQLALDAHPWDVRPRAERLDLWTELLPARGDVLAARKPVAESVQELLADGADDLLEWLVLTRGWGTAGRQLKAMGSPRWARAATWVVEHPDGHMAGSARDALLADDTAAAVLGWMVDHGDALPAALVPLREQLGRKTSPAADHGLAPLHDADVLLAPLSADPADIHGWDARQVPGRLTGRPTGPPRADAFHVPEVLAAIEMLWTSKRRDATVTERVLALGDAADVQVSTAAFELFTRYGPANVPADALLAIAADEQESDRRRRLALLGASYADRPAAWIGLHETLADTGHPAWAVALEQLGVRGNGFTRQQLMTVLEDVPAGTDPAVLQATLERLDRRASDTHPDRQVDVVVPMLERAAWVDIHCHPLEATLPAWTLVRLRELADLHPAVRAELERVRDTYEPEPHRAAATVFDTLENRVRSYAGRVLGDE